MNIINLTPHTLNIYNEGGEEIASLPPSGTVARVAVSKEPAERMSRWQADTGIPFFDTAIGSTDGLPEESPTTIYVVSGLFRQQCPRSDLWQPGELLRNEAGQPIGCIGLSQ